jgi:acetyl esterase
MTDYDRLIDAETWAFINKTEAFYFRSTGDATIAGQREMYDRMCASFRHAYPEGVSAENKVIRLKDRSIAVRRYRAMHYDAHAMVLYFHGGGFVVGSLDSHDDICAEICHRTGYEVVSVDYRLAPEHLHPASFDDALAAFRWALEAYDLPIVLAGDSAGGNLAAAVSHHVRKDKRRPVGQMLIYPLLGADMNHGSYLTHADAPMLTVRNLDYYRSIRSGGNMPKNDPRFSPLSDRDFTDLPPTVLITAQCDPLASDGEAYHDQIARAGGKAWWHEEPGLVHGFLRARHSVTRARAAFTRIIDEIRMLGRGEWWHTELVAATTGRTHPASSAVHPVD